MVLIGGVVSPKVCVSGGGKPLSFAVGYNKKAVLANTSRYQTYPVMWAHVSLAEGNAAN
tara:strand:- start:33 stop:209 length:177 start_codon:yes stop_codon:yes gene_type:complete